MTPSNSCRVPAQDDRPAPASRVRELALLRGLQRLERQCAASEEGGRSATQHRRDDVRRRLYDPAPS